MIIRKLKLSDATGIAETLNNTKIREKLTDRLPFPYTEKDGEDFINSMLASEGNTTFTRALECDGKCIGTVTATRQADIERLSAEIGYSLNIKYQGNGYMSEAVRVLCNEIFEKTDIIRIYANVFEDNYASRKVLEKCGFKLEGTLINSVIKNGRVQNTVIYGLVK